MRISPLVLSSAFQRHQPRTDATEGCRYAGRVVRPRRARTRPRWPRCAPRPSAGRQFTSTSPHLGSSIPSSALGETNAGPRRAPELARRQRRAHLNLDRVSLARPPCTTLFSRAPKRASQACARALGSHTVASATRTSRPGRAGRPTLKRRHLCTGRGAFVRDPDLGEAAVCIEAGCPNVERKQAGQVR